MISPNKMVTDFVSNSKKKIKYIAWYINTNEHDPTLRKNVQVAIDYCDQIAHELHLINSLGVSYNSIKFSELYYEVLKLYRAKQECDDLFTDELYSKLEEIRDILKGKNNGGWDSTTEKKKSNGHICKGNGKTDECISNDSLQLGDESEEARKCGDTSAALQSSEDS